MIKPEVVPDFIVSDPPVNLAVEFYGPESEEASPNPGICSNPQNISEESDTD